MKKGIIIILAVAIIGALGIYSKSHNTSANQPSTTNGSPVQGAASSSDQNSAASNTGTGNLRDGTFTGDSEDTPYGTVQIAVIVSSGKITDINFLQMPNDQEHSMEITSASEPLLKQETIQKQSAHIDFISGATVTSDGYQQSLQSALDQAA